MGPHGRLVVCDSGLGHESQMRKENKLVDEKAASLGEMWEQDLISDVLQKRSSRKKGSYSKPWSPAENEKFFNMLRDHGTDFQMMEEMFSDRSRLELKRKFKREERTWKREPGFKAWEPDDLDPQTEAVCSMGKVKAKKKKVGPRRRYKNKGFYESSSDEDCAAEEKPVKFTEQSASRVALSKKVRQEGFPKMPVLMHQKSDTHDDQDRRSGLGGLLKLLDPFGIPVADSRQNQKRVIGSD